MEFPLAGFAAAAGTLAFFGGIALLMWVDQRGKHAQRQLTHAERLRSLELRHELPDVEVARAESRSSRAWAVALVGWLVPLLALGAGVGATALILLLASEHVHLAVLCTIWGVCGLVSVVAVNVSLGALKPEHDHEDEQEPSAPEPKTSPPARAKPEQPAEPRHVDLEFMSK
jgi:hypothetical protein